MDPKVARMIVPAVAVALAAFLVVLLGLLVFVGTGGGGDEAQTANNATSTVTASATASQTPTSTPSPSATPTASPSATAPPTATRTSPPATATPTQPPPTATPRTPASEAVAFCASAGTVDAPATAMPNAPRLMNGERPLVWRCWQGKVLVCEPGAQLFPCGKMDVTRTPNQATQTYCHDMPDASSVPKVVTGQATIYDWGCQAGVPVILRQVVAPNQVDSRGFVIGVWNELKL